MTSFRNSKLANQGAPTTKFLNHEFPTGIRLLPKVVGARANSLDNSLEDVSSVRLASSFRPCWERESQRHRQK